MFLPTVFLRHFQQLLQSDWLTNLARRENVIEILQEGFIFNVIISEYKAHRYPLLPSSPVQDLQIIHQIAAVIGPGQCYLECLVARDEGGKFGEGLFT